MGLFSFFKKTLEPAPTPAVREVLFGDVPVLDWPQADSPVRTQGAWALFAAAQAAYQANDPAAAVVSLQQVLALPDLESRHYLQAWHFLRLLGVQPPASEAKRVLGVVVEVALPEGLDLVAAYPNNSARYYNYSGAGVVWEQDVDLKGGPIQALLAAAEPVAAAIGPWLEARLAAPATGMVRLNILTPSGLHFGQGDMKVFFQDPMAAPVLLRAQALMEALMAIGTTDKEVA
jgi:hypothetical protein